MAGTGTDRGGHGAPILRGLVAHDDPATNGALVGVTVVAVAALLAIGIASRRPNWPVYLVVVLLGLVAVVAVHRRHPLSLATRAGLVLFGVGHVAGGMVPVGDDVLYGLWILEPVIRYDNLQHAVGFAFVGRATWEVLRPRLAPAETHDRPDDPVVTWWVAVLATAAWGAGNEIVEWIMTLSIPGTDVGGYDNTARDLVANLVGGVLLATWTARRPPPLPLRRGASRGDEPVG